MRLAPGLRLPERLPRTHLSMLSAVPKQAECLDSKTLRDACNVVDRDVSFRSLDRTQIGPIDPAFVSQSLLAQTARSAKSSHILREDIP